MLGEKIRRLELILILLREGFCDQALWLWPDRGCLKLQYLNLLSDETLHRIGFPCIDIVTSEISHRIYFYTLRGWRSLIFFKQACVLDYCENLEASKRDRFSRWTDTLFTFYVDRLELGFWCFIRLSGIWSRQISSSNPIFLFFLRDATKFTGSSRSVDLDTEPTAPLSIVRIGRKLRRSKLYREVFSNPN